MNHEKFPTLAPISVCSAPFMGAAAAPTMLIGLAPDPIGETLSGNRNIVMPPSPTTKRVAHRTALAAAALWWGYAFLSTSLFTNLSGVGLIIYLLGLPVCYALVWLAVHGVAWLIASARS